MKCMKSFKLRDPGLLLTVSILPPCFCSYFNLELSLLVILSTCITFPYFQSGSGNSTILEEQESKFTSVQVCSFNQL